MSHIEKHIRETYPDWVQKKSRQPRPAKAIRQRNGQKTNAHQTAMQPEYITFELPQA